MAELLWVGVRELRIRSPVLGALRGTHYSHFLAANDPPLKIVRLVSKNTPPSAKNKRKTSAPNRA